MNSLIDLKIDKFLFSDISMHTSHYINRNKSSPCTTSLLLSKMKTYTRSIDGFDRKGSSGINCSAIEISVANIQRGVWRILRSCRRMSDYRWLTCHTHHLTLFLNVTFRLIDPLFPHAVLLLPVVLVLS